MNIDGGASVDVETGMMYVGSQSGMSVIQLQKDPCSEFDYSSIHDSCGKGGALPTPAGYVAQAGTQGEGFTRRGAFGRFGSGRDAISIVKPKEMGGITAYDMNSGDKKWWQSNGGFIPAPKIDTGLFAGVKLAPTPNPGQAQIITTKSLMIYGTGRNAGPSVRGANAKLFAVDKATGAEVGAVKIPSPTTAVPMTFMHQGKQYIVFATGEGSNTSLVALALPRN